MSLLDDLDRLRNEAAAAFAAAGDAKALEAARIKFLGANGQLKGLLAQLGGVPADIRPQAGKRANEVKRELDEAFAKAKAGQGPATALALAKEIGRAHV